MDFATHSADFLVVQKKLALNYGEIPKSQLSIVLV
jgi:hypothetical protein